MIAVFCNFKSRSGDGRYIGVCHELIQPDAIRSSSVDGLASQAQLLASTTFMARGGLIRHALVELSGRDAVQFLSNAYRRSKLTCVSPVFFDVRHVITVSALTRNGSRSSADVLEQADFIRPRRRLLWSTYERIRATDSNEFVEHELAVLGVQNGERFVQVEEEMNRWAKKHGARAKLFPGFVDAAAARAFMQAKSPNHIGVSRRFPRL